MDNENKVDNELEGNIFKKLALVEKVEFLTEKGTHQKNLKCKGCGRGFNGRADANACSDKCQKRLQRG